MWLPRALTATLGLTTMLALPGAVAAGPIDAPRWQAQKPADDTLRDRIAYRLDTDTTARHYDIKVKVDMGIATLSGTVATAAQKADAARVAKIPGVSKVVNDVTVDPGVDKTLADRMKTGMSKTGEAISDAWITTKVKWFFLGDDLLKGSSINVDTAKHVVTLKGTVKTAAGRARAKALAQQTEGVDKVVDELTIAK